MKEKLLWAVCLTILGLAAVLMGLSRLVWAGVPDIMVRALGVVMLVTLPVFAFITVRLAARRNGK